MKHGLSESQFNEVIKIISEYKEIDEAVLFGSRAMNTFKEASDVDIAIKGEKASHELASRLKCRFEEDTNLPFFFDFISYPNLNSKDIKKHIDKYGVVIYRRGWREMKLGEAPVEIIDGDRGKNYPKKEEFFSQGHCLFLNTKNVTDRGFSFSELNFITKEKDETLRKGKLKRNDVILTTRGTVGNVFFYDRKAPFKNVRINSGMVIIRPNGIDSKFNYQLFKYLKNDFLDFTSESTQPQLPIRDIQKISIFLPPLSEQKAIAAILSSLDDKIDLLHRQNETLENIAQALFRKWFIEDRYEGWEEKSLGDFFPVITGKKDANYSTEDGQYLFFTCPQNVLKSPDYSYEGKAILLAGNGDFNVRRYVGKFEAYQRTYVLIPYEDKYFGFLYTLIKYYLVHITGGVQGSVIRFITKAMITDFTFSLPKTNFDNELEHINQIYLKVDSNQFQIHILEKLRDLLLPKLLDGHVRVRN